MSTTRHDSTVDKGDTGIVPTRVIRARALVWERNPLFRKMKPECGEESGPDRLTPLPPEAPTRPLKQGLWTVNISSWSWFSFPHFPGKERVHDESETVQASGLDYGLPWFGTPKKGIKATIN